MKCLAVLRHWHLTFFTFSTPDGLKAYHEKAINKYLHIYSVFDIAEMYSKDAKI